MLGLSGMGLLLNVSGQMLLGAGALSECYGHLALLLERHPSWPNRSLFGQVKYTP